jgi:hypothetical protein
LRLAKEVRDKDSGIEAIAAMVAGIAKSRT